MPLQVYAPDTIQYAANPALFVVNDNTVQPSSHIEWELSISKDGGNTFFALPLYCTPMYQQGADLISYTNVSSIIEAYTWQEEGQPFVPDCGSGVQFRDPDTFIRYQIKCRTVERGGTTGSPTYDFDVRWAANGGVCDLAQSYSLVGLPVWLTNQPNAMTFSCGQPLWMSTIIALPPTAFPLKIKFNRYLTNNTAAMGEVGGYINYDSDNPPPQKYHLRADIPAYFPSADLSELIYYEFYLSDVNDNIITPIRKIYLTCCSNTDLYLLIWNSKGGFDNVLIKNYTTTANSANSTAVRAFDPYPYTDDIGLQGSYKPAQIGKMFNYCTHSQRSYNAELPPLAACFAQYAEEIINAKWAALIRSRTECPSCNISRQCYYSPVMFPPQTPTIYNGSPQIQSPTISFIEANEYAYYCPR